MSNSFNTRTTLEVNRRSYEIHSLQRLSDSYDVMSLPYSLKILLENLLRCENGTDVTQEQILSIANWDENNPPQTEIGFSPARVLMQDFTGVPAIVDLASMRDSLAEMGYDPRAVNPVVRTDLVIDHSVMVDHFGTNNAIDLNAVLEYKRNAERYTFLRWGQNSFNQFSVVPPSTGIVHQVNLEFLATVISEKQVDSKLYAFPDTVVGTDSHTTMINGIGVLGWGVGGIEAEAAMLGESIAMLLPRVVGCRLHGSLPEGATATDLVLTVVELLRNHGVVGKFVEFFGDGLDHLSVSDQATISNMAPEYGATCGVFPIDENTLKYLRLTGRNESAVALVEAYARHQGMFKEPGQSGPARYNELVELDLSEVEPSLAGPKRPQDRVLLRDAKQTVEKSLSAIRSSQSGVQSIDVDIDDQSVTLSDGDVVVAAITSCTNTSNPAVVVAAGLLAKKAVDAGLSVKPWVKTSLAPGSQVVSEYLEQSGLMESLQRLGFSIVGYGCTTCIGNSGPLPEGVAKGIKEGELVVSSVLSGNRNFEGRVHAAVKMNFLASPPLVVAYALAGSMNVDLSSDSIGVGTGGNKVYLKDIWPTNSEINEVIDGFVNNQLFRTKYANVFRGDDKWAEIPVVQSGQYKWDDSSTYIRKAPYIGNVANASERIDDILGARVLAMLGDSVTTDHISPAGAIMPASPAGQYLIQSGVPVSDFNSYGSRRGNHEVMMRGTFANVRLRNELAPGTEGGWTRHMPSGETMTIYDASVRYREQRTPLIIIGGKEYGSGSSRDWAAKGPLLLGVKAVIVETYERIHRSNLAGMGILPLQFCEGESRQALNLTGEEVFHIKGLEKGVTEIEVVATRADGSHEKFSAIVRIDTPREWEYYQSQGILRYVLKRLTNRPQVREVV
ncbi:MAG: aconitate hydratase AcnA [Acidiferrobacterales bacterium]|nr:aconitate hydratase AcnA [Acidiferrobacterales bacterium]